MKSNIGLVIKKLITEDGYHVGHFVDFPGCIVQAKTAEEFEKKAKEIGLLFLDFLKTSIENEKLEIIIVKKEEEYFSD
jgi:predicted RNase H-like HicB family nuclease